MSRKLIGMISIFVLAGVLSGVCYANSIPTQITFGPNSAGTIAVSTAGPETFSGVWGWAYQGAASGNPGFTMANETLTVDGVSGGIFTLAPNADTFTVSIGSDFLSGTLSLDTVTIPKPGLAFFEGTLTINSASSGFQSSGFPVGAVVDADFAVRKGMLSDGELVPGVPEPGTIALVGSGLLAIAGALRRRS